MIGILTAERSAFASADAWAPPIRATGRVVLRRCGDYPCPPSGFSRVAAEQDLRRRGGGGGGFTAPPIVRDVIGGPGTALGASMREPFERALGHDFSSVRIHADAPAARSATAVGAAAYTVGRDIVFNDGRYAPATTEGRKLLGHELVHVVQQSATTSGRSALRVGSSADPAEDEADTIAATFDGPTRSGEPTSRSAGQHTLAEARCAVLQRYAESTEPTSGWSEFLKDVLIGPARTIINVPCLQALEKPMGAITFDWIPKACRREASGFLPSRNWDAFGHCWIGCEGTRRCGESPTRSLGTGREISRELGFGGPHDSFRQDVRNQAKGRRLAHEPGVCSTLCDDAARSGWLDFTAPRRKCANCATWETTGINDPCPAP